VPCRSLTVTDRNDSEIKLIGALDPLPRIHDLRHAFARRRLRDWYAAGVDVAPLVASLATYLGHAHVTDTYWYLTASPDLLAQAADRIAALIEPSTPRERAE
jgi:integrase